MKNFIKITSVFFVTLLIASFTRTMQSDKTIVGVAAGNENFTTLVMIYELKGPY